MGVDRGPVDRCRFSPGQLIGDKSSLRSHRWGGCVWRRSAPRAERAGVRRSAENGPPQRPDL